ncbi:HAD-like domain-containing protein [Artemisia annua]|uniref:HAD-like domain-containing protein n=1 Tax=Artemisia annua TaxID=35608 RepID=A0A2U1LQZ8_ARTAN|nr:HAD-like domain-containing protein [Artemisia annua]
MVGESMVKEGVEDWRQFIHDKEVNSRKITVHTANRVLADRAKKKLHIGDVTMNLDSESKLKIKRCTECTLCFDDAVKFGNFRGTIRCEDPNQNIYSFVGNLELGDEGEDSKFPISPSQIPLCKSKFRNTEFIY